MIGSWPREPDLAERENLADLETVAGGPLAGLLPEGSGALPRESSALPRSTVSAAASAALGARAARAKPLGGRSSRIGHGPTVIFVPFRRCLII